MIGDDDDRLSHIAVWIPFLDVRTASATIEHAHRTADRLVLFNLCVELLGREERLRPLLLVTAKSAAESLPQTPNIISRASALSLLVGPSEAPLRDELIATALDLAAAKLNEAAAWPDAAFRESESPDDDVGEVRRADEIASSVVQNVAPYLQASHLPLAFALARRIRHRGHRAPALVALAGGLDVAHRAAIADELLSATPHPSERSGDEHSPRRVVMLASLLLDEERRAELLAPVAGSDDWLSLLGIRASLPQALRVELLDKWLAEYDEARRPSRDLVAQIANLPVPARDACVQHLAIRLQERGSDALPVLWFHLVPYLPVDDATVDRCLAGAPAALAQGGAVHTWRRAAPRMTTDQLDRVLDLVEAATRSAWSRPQDERLTVMAVVGAERMRRDDRQRARLVRWLLDVAVGRPDTRHEAFIVLEEVAELIVALGGSGAAQAIVAAMEENAAGWP